MIIDYLNLIAFVGFTKSHSMNHWHSISIFELRLVKLLLPVHSAKMFWIFVFLLMYVSLCSCQITSYERPDGSFYIGHSSESQGDTGEALSALLTYASGWTDSDRDYASDIPHLIPSIDMREVRGVFESSMNTLVENTRRILRRNSEVIGVINRVVSIVFNYLRYIGRAMVGQFNRWVSQNQRRISYADRF